MSTYDLALTLELEPPHAARVVRGPHAGTSDGWTLTEGPVAEGTEQVGGIHVVRCDVVADLMEACGRLAGGEPAIEVRAALGTGGVS